MKAKTVTNQKHVIVTLPALLVGGTEMQTLQQVRVLVAAGYRVTVCCFYKHEESMRCQMVKAGARVMLLGADSSAGLLPLLRRLVAFFRQERPDIVHVQYIAPGLIAILAARMARVPVVFATVHQPGRTYGWKAKMLIRSAARFCNAFFCVSRAAEESWFGNSEMLDPEAIQTKRKHFTIYNSIDIDNIDNIIGTSDPVEIKRSFNISDRKIIGVVGRLRYEKGQKVLLHAMSEVIHKCPDVMLLVVGDGPDREDLKLTAERLEIQDHIIWSGMKTPDEVCKLYPIMDVVAVPSLFEGFGLVAAEAMAAGLPVVAAKVDGLCEIIEDGVTGYLVPANDAQALAGALIQLLNNPKHLKMMGLNGRDRVGQLYSIKHFSASLIAAYNTFQD